MKFNCSKCGSDNVYEQHSIMIPMNHPMEWGFHLGDCRAEGVFYCDDCQGSSQPACRGWSPRWDEPGEDGP